MKDNVVPIWFADVLYVYIIADIGLFITAKWAFS